MEIQEMLQGSVKWFNPEKGFGFIKPDNGGSDLFVHHSETNGVILNEGDSVEYEIGEGRKGPCAVNVKKL
ncbi:MAG: cold-shock protein [Xenococcaceae cyanobacterium MO_167.B52]|nr:cold-shock protein [Xenococcaceae cyanobacterium MO_167.B52]